MLKMTPMYKKFQANPGFPSSKHTLTQTGANTRKMMMLPGRDWTEKSPQIVTATLPDVFVLQMELQENKILVTT